MKSFLFYGVFDIVGEIFRVVFGSSRVGGFGGVWVDSWRLVGGR